MKRFTLIIFLIILLWNVRGQTSGTWIANVCDAAYSAEPDPLNPMLIKFSDHSSGLITDWQWNFGDGATSTLQNPQHTYLAGGTYFVCLTVFNSTPGNECHDFLCLAITVHEPGACIADYQYTFEPSNQLAGHFSDVSSGNINGWHWDFGDGSTADVQNPVHSFPAPGKYRVCLTAYNIDSISTCNDIKCDSITVEPSAECHAAFSATLDSINLEPNTFRFVSQSTGNPSSYFWKFGDGSTSEASQVAHQFKNLGTYTICLTVRKKIQGTEVCIDSVCHSVTTASYFDIGGHLFAGSQPINNPVSTGDTGVATLYRVEGSRLQLYETRSFTHLGYYAFPRKLNGNYIVRAALTPGSAHHQDFFTGYSHQTMHWKDAEILPISDSNAYAADIHLSPVKNGLAGPASISGVVEAGGLNVLLMKVPNAEVILYDAQMSPVRFFNTGVSGAFDFHELPYGAYHLYVEYPGKYSRLTAVWLDATTPVADSLQLELFDHDVTAVNDISSGGIAIGELFPNPAISAVSLSLVLENPATLTLEIRSLTGQVIWSGVTVFNAGANQASIPLTSVHRGLYLFIVSTMDGTMVAVKKLIRN